MCFDFAGNDEKKRTKIVENIEFALAMPNCVKFDTKFGISIFWQSTGDKVLKQHDIFFGFDKTYSSSVERL